MALCLSVEWAAGAKEKGNSNFNKIGTADWQCERPLTPQLHL
jgi:hypothetical protein